MEEARSMAAGNRMDARHLPRAAACNCDDRAVTRARASLRLFSCALVAFALAGGVATQAFAALKTIEPQDIVDLRGVSDPQVSADGKSILFVVADRKSGVVKDETSIWRVESDGQSPARLYISSDGTDNSPRWSPDGKRIAFLSARKNPLSAPSDPALKFTTQSTEPYAADAPDDPKSQQLWLLSTSGGEATPLTFMKSDISGFRWSPDGKRIAFIAADPESKTSGGPAPVEVDKDFKVGRLWIYDFASRTAKLVTPAGLHVTDVEWSPDSQQLVIRACDAPRLNEYWYRSRLVLVDAESNKLGAVLTTHASATPPRWSRDGTRIAWSELLTGGISISVGIYDVRSGQSKLLAQDYRGVPGVIEWSPNNSELIVQSFEGTTTLFITMNANTGAIRKIADAPAIGPYGFTMSKDARTIVHAGESASHPREVWVLRNGRNAPVTNFNPQVETWNKGTVREITWKSSKDKTLIYGVLVTPPGYVDGTPNKTVVQVHGGPEWAWWSAWLGDWHAWAQMLASHGYVVLLPNPRGSDGQGAAFARGAINDWGGGDYQDVMDGADELIKQHIADPETLGIGGWSYGGYMSAWAISHTNRFKAAVVGAAPTDLSTMALTTDTPDFMTGYFGDVQKSRRLYDERSPARYLDQVNTPALILHGEDDKRVPISQGEQFYIGLREQGKPVEFVRYPKAPHWFHYYDYEKDVMTRVLAWYDRYLR